MNCAWSQWGDWGPCSVSCGDGWKPRTRRVVTEAQNGGIQCQGDGIETGRCKKKDCTGQGTGMVNVTVSCNVPAQKLW